MTSEERWLSVEEIAVHMGVSKEKVYRWLEGGKIPSHRIGKLWKFKATEVDEQVRQGGASAPPVGRKDSATEDGRGN